MLVIKYCQKLMKISVADAGFLKEWVGGVHLWPLRREGASLAKGGGAGFGPS